MRILKDFLKILWYKIGSMAYPYTPQLGLPLKNWEVNDVGFLQRQVYSDVDWGKHLGEDCIKKAGSPVRAIGRGKIVYSASHTSPTPPESEGKKGSNWGNIIIIAHKNPRTKEVFFSLYGHLGKRMAKKGKRVELGQQIGIVGKGWTKENGWWNQSHLHLAIYIGPWKGIVLPGAYRRGEKRTKLDYWRASTEFIENYSS